MTNKDRMQREANLMAAIRRKLPDFAQMCADDTETVMLHQDSFAADYQDEEYMLLGIAIKYAGLRSKELRVIGRNHSSFNEEEKIQ
jgi:sulfite reductase beta subunit-like hemoprotein